MEGRYCLLLHVLHNQVCNQCRAVNLPVYFAFKGQVDGLQAELEKGADVIHGEASSVWKRWVIHQTVTSNLDGSGGWHTGDKRHDIERH